VVAQGVDERREELAGDEECRPEPEPRSLAATVVDGRLLDR